MQRVRRENPLSALAGNRMLWAIGLSAALHASAIALVGAQDSRRPASRATVIAARLVHEPVSTPAPARHAPIAAVSHSTPPLPKPAAEPQEAPATDSAPASAPAGPVEPPDPIALPALEEVPDSVHYAARDLDVYPRLERRLSPVYPALALGERLPGKVTLLVLIDERGRVTDASIVDAIPAGVFEASAREAFLQSAFAPAERAGRKVRSRILVDVDYDPDKPVQ